MFSTSFVPLVGGLVPLFILPSIVSSKPSSFSFRAPGGGVQFLNGPVTSGVFTSDNKGYLTDITLGGLDLTVLLDTGSSDLIIFRNGQDLDFTQQTNVPAGVTFGSGSNSGTVAFADLQMGDFIIRSQAFIDLPNNKNIGTAPNGVLGMSSNALSTIIPALANASDPNTASEVGQPPMLALFGQQSNLPRSFDVQLSRADLLGDVSQGTFIIGEHADEFQTVQSAPRITTVNDQHWSVLLDGINVPGGSFSFANSSVQGVPAGKVVAILDTGFTFPQLPAAAVDAIYSRFPGAIFDKASTKWFVPCNATAEVEFVLGGVRYPVHPLDLTTTVTGPVGPNNANATACINTFQVSALNPTEFTGFDVVLGDAFLRNVYVSFNYGDQQTTPFVQMVSTAPSFQTAQDEFLQARAKVLATLPPEVDLSQATTGEQSQSTTSGATSSSAGKMATQTSSTVQPSATQSDKPKPNAAVDGLRSSAALVGAVAILFSWLLL
ncbi:acid protease [Trametes polyzona]|nr:acid protease [Trametes polyzona]